MIWTERPAADKQAVVRELVQQQGATYSEAAEQLGTSRVAIAGVVERAKQGGQPILNDRLPRQQKPRGKRTKRTKRKEQTRHQGLTRYVPIEDALPPPDPQPFESKAWLPLPRAHPIAITDHREGQCRFPHGDGPFSYCGKPVKVGKVYCEAHCAIAYREVRT